MSWATAEERQEDVQLYISAWRNGTGSTGVTLRAAEAAFVELLGAQRRGVPLKPQLVFQATIANHVYQCLGEVLSGSRAGC